MNPHGPKTVPASKAERLGSNTLSPGVPPEEVPHLRPPFRARPPKQSDLAEDVVRADAANDEAPTLALAIVGEYPSDPPGRPLRADARGKVPGNAPVGEDPVEGSDVGASERAQLELPSAQGGRRHGPGPRFGTVNPLSLRPPRTWGQVGSLAASRGPRTLASGAVRCGSAVVRTRAARASCSGRAPRGRSRFTSSGEPGPLASERPWSGGRGRSECTRCTRRPGSVRPPHAVDAGEGTLGSRTPSSCRPSYRPNHVGTEP
jgi:hypothetical protein